MHAGGREQEPEAVKKRCHEFSGIAIAIACCYSFTREGDFKLDMLSHYFISIPSDNIALETKC